ncbi:MAG: prolipoprotein diacylglyceryl transferase [Clostridia bacterium]|nr:prolipoprotein diacylglyceryl transferase [Clostridia bacterium]
MNTHYVLTLYISAIVCAIAHYFLLKRQPKRGAQAVLTLCLGIVLGTACARLIYCLMQVQYIVADGFLATLLSQNVAQLSYYGGCIGVILAVMLSAKITGQKALNALNLYAPAGALMAALARFAEIHLGTLCAGNYIENESFCFFPLAIPNEWEEWYLAVFVLAGISYLVVFVFSWIKFKDHCFLRTVFYLCLPQILWESLRNQSIIWHEFVRLEQLLCMVVMEVILVLYGIWSKGQKKRFLPAVTGLLCAGVFVAVEFALDKSDLPRALSYAIMVLGLCALGFMECLGHRKARKAGW